MSDTKTWIHSRKGKITGREVSTTADDVWMRVQLVGDHHLRWGSESNRGRVDEDGSTMTFRRAFLTEVNL